MVVFVVLVLVLVVLGVVCLVLVAVVACHYFYYHSNHPQDHKKTYENINSYHFWTKIDVFSYMEVSPGRISTCRIQI